MSAARPSSWSPRKVNLRGLQSRSTESDILASFQRRNVTKRLGKIGDKYGKIRSCSLGQRGVSASLLDLQDKNITFNENVNDLVQTSIKSLRKFTSSDEAEVVSLSQTSFAACSMTSKVAHETLLLIRQTSLASSLLSSDSCDSLPASGTRTRHRRTRQETVGRLDPALYRGPATSSSSSLATLPLGSVHLSYTWIGEHYDQLKIRILKVKNILEEYSRAGLYFRIQCVSPTAQSPTFQSSTQYGEDKRYFNDDFVFKLPGDLKSLKIWGVVYLSNVHHQVVANFVHNFEQHRNSKILKLPLIISEDENYNSKQNKLNVALKFSPKDNNINIIIFKCVLEGIFIEKKSNLYIKISLIEKKKEFSSKKVWCSNNKTTIDFSKEIVLNLHDRDARNCSLLFQLKKYSGLGSRNEKLSQLVLGGEGDPSSHYCTMLHKPGDRIFVWHNAECF